MTEKTMWWIMGYVVLVVTIIGILALCGIDPGCSHDCFG